MPNQAAAVGRLYSLFAGLFLLQVGQMLLGMGLSLKVPELYSDAMAGIILSVFSLGLILGAVYSRDLIEQIGHIRAFAAFATVMSATVVFHALIEDPYVWLLLRLVAGFCFGGLVAIFESWISDAAEPESRGFVVGSYQFIGYLGQALGMLLASFVNVDGNLVFLVASVVLSVSLVPIVLTRVHAPTPAPFRPKGLGELFNLSPLALAGAVGSGFVFGILYVLTAIYLERGGQSDVVTTYVYVAFVLGGMLFQIPLALVADRFDRRFALLGVFLFISVVAGAVMIRVTMGAGTWELLGWFFAIGGATAWIYPIALARAYDYLAPEKYVAAASAMIMSYSAAAFIGPAIGGFAMQQFGFGVFFPMILVVAVAMALFTIYRMIIGESMSVAEQEDIVVMPTRLSSSAGLMLDPRTPELAFEFGEGEEDWLADDELMGTRFDPNKW